MVTLTAIASPYLYVKLKWSHFKCPGVIVYRFLRAGGRGGKAGPCKAEALPPRRPGEVASSLKDKTGG